MSQLKPLNRLAKDRAACEEIYKAMFPIWVARLGDGLLSARNYHGQYVLLRGGFCAVAIKFDGTIGMASGSPNPNIDPWDLVSLFTKLGYEPKRP